MVVTISARAKRRSGGLGDERGDHFEKDDPWIPVAQEEHCLRNLGIHPQYAAEEEVGIFPFRKLREGL